MKLCVQPDPRWEVVLAISDGQFAQISFVNSICTVKGGSHVNHIVDNVSQSATQPLSQSVIIIIIIIIIASGKKKVKLTGIPEMDDVNLAESRRSVMMYSLQRGSCYVRHCQTQEVRTLARFS